MSKKMGRPKAEKPKSNLVACRLTDEDLIKLREYCKIHNMTYSDVLVKGLHILLNKEL
jgi:hypothetical protein